MTLSQPAFGALGAGLPGDGPTPPSLDDLRGALRSPQVPLASPATVRDAAERILDLMREDRLAEADALVRRAERTGLDDGSDPGRIAYARSVAALALRGTDVQAQQHAFARYVDLLTDAGYPLQARASAQVLGERAEHLDGAGTGSSGSPRRADSPRRAGSAHRHLRAPSGPQLPPEMLEVVAADHVPVDPDAPADREVDRLRSALAALPAVRDSLATDPREVLTVRLAEAMRAAGRTEDATACAFDVLDLETDRWVGAGRRAGDPRPEAPGRPSARAHAVLAEILVTRSPLEAADHAVQALRDLTAVDDPQWRVRLVTALLDALRSAGLFAQADFTAGRLLALQRHLPQAEDRVRPLLAVVRHRIATRQDEAALSTLDEVRRIADVTHDRGIRIAAARERARLEREREDWPAQILALQGLAEDARWLVDDLATPDGQRERLARDELDAQALVMRYSLELGGYEDAHLAARAMIRRTRPDQGLDGLGAALLWDHEVDARVGDLIATGMRLVDGVDGVVPEDYDRLRHEAMVVIGAVPAGHEDRAEYWGVYLDDRHAVMLAARGLERPARRAARRAREGWGRLDRSEDLERMETELRRWLPEG
jgi:hypothetical protein